MTEDYTPSINIEPPPDSDEQALFASLSLGMFDNSSNYCASSNDFSMNFGTSECCFPQVPALFIQPSDSPSPKLSTDLSPSDDYSPGYLHTERFSSGRSSPVELWSPASSYSGDIFPDDFSQDDSAPYWAQPYSGHSSPAVSPSLSPLTSAFDGFALDESYPTVDHSVLPNGPPAVSRLRSSSHSVQTASPVDVWGDGVGRGRSSSFSVSTTDNQFYRTESGSQSNLPQYGYPDNTEVHIAVADANVAYTSDSLGTGMSWGAMPATENNRGIAGDSLSPGHLMQAWKYPGNERSSMDSFPDRPPPSPTHLAVPPVGLQRRGACVSRRTRSHSDLNTLVPPDQDAGRGRGQHRSALSIPTSRSVSNGSRAASPHSPLFIGDIRTPASFSSSSPSSPAFEDAETEDNEGGVSIGRRRTFTAIRGPDDFLSPASTLTRASSAPSKGRRSRPAHSPAHSEGMGVFKAVKTEASSFLPSLGGEGSPSQSTLQQEFRIMPSSLAAFKPEVASKKIRQASSARRINIAAFVCPLATCSSTFTARHNLVNHINSHNKHRPHRCLCGMSFTTQGVLNRHKKRCGSRK